MNDSEEPASRGEILRVLLSPKCFLVPIDMMCVQLIFESDQSRGVFGPGEGAIPKKRNGRWLFLFVFFFCFVFLHLHRRQEC